MSRNHYGTLGVEPDASEEEIKSAYRREAKRVHPDHAAGGCEPFRAVRDAYDVLSDPVRRRNYDKQLARERYGGRAGRGVRPDPLLRRRGPAEPLVPTGRTATSDALGASFEGSLWNWMDEVLEQRGVHSGPWPVRGSSARSAAPVLGEVEIRLALHQARRGGLLRLWVPVRTLCPMCQGDGGPAFYYCRECGGRGVVIRETPVEIEFPAGVGDGSVGRVPLDRFGMPGQVLTLRFAVRGW